MSNASKPRSTRLTKRKVGGTSTRGAIPVDELARSFSNLLQPAQFQFNADDAEEKERLAVMLWQSDGLLDPEAPTLRSANPEFVYLLVLLTQNTYGVVDPSKEALWQESILSNLTRIKSQKQHTILTARVSIEAHRVQLNRDFWQLLHLLAPGILTAHRWADEFLEFAAAFRPGPRYEVLEGVGCVMFDNYTRKVLYSSVHTKDTWGFRLDMTNSCSMRIPKHLAPANFDAKAICVCHPCPAHTFSGT